MNDFWNGFKSILVTFFHSLQQFFNQLFIIYYLKIVKQFSNFSIMSHYLLDYKWLQWLRYNS